MFIYPLFGGVLLLAVSAAADTTCQLAKVTGYLHCKESTCFLTLYKGSASEVTYTIKQSPLRLRRYADLSIQTQFELKTMSALKPLAKWVPSPIRVQEPQMTKNDLIFLKEISCESHS